MENKRFIYRNKNHLEAIPTAHQCGVKKVLLANNETGSNITQIALAKLHSGEQVENHVHPTMDEHFFVLSGRGHIEVDGIQYYLDSGTFVLVPAGSEHAIAADTEIEFITIGVAYDL